MFNFKKTLTLGVAALLWTGTTHAAVVTLNEAGMDGVYSQASFGNTPIDIRYGAVTNIVAPNLLNIDTDAEITQLFNLHAGSFDTVNFYFVDTVDACGGFNVNIVGCGEKPGNDFVVESDFAAGGFGTELLAHELGHNLDLGHTIGGLMNASLNGSTLLTTGQVSTIFNSNLVKQDANGFYININPVLITAAAPPPPPPPPNPVPVPATLLLMFAGLLAMRLRPSRAAR